MKFELVFSPFIANQLKIIIMKRSTLLLLSFFFAFATANAQLYTTAAGLRMGTDWGFTIQQRVANKLTVEGIVQSSLQREEVLVTGILQKHNALITKGLNIYFGAGLHKGWNTANTTTEVDAPQATNDPFGVTLVGGAEMTLGRFNISYDFKPAINVSGGEKNFYTQSGVSLRYVIVKNKVFKDMQKKKKKRQKSKRKSKQETPKWQFWKKNR